MLLTQLSPGCPPPSFPRSVLTPMVEISPHLLRHKPRHKPRHLRGRPGESCASCREGESWKRGAPLPRRLGNGRPGTAGAALVPWERLAGTRLDLVSLYVSWVFGMGRVGGWKWHPATPHPQFQTSEIACM